MLCLSSLSISDATSNPTYHISGRLTDFGRLWGDLLRMRISPLIVFALLNLASFAPALDVFSRTLMARGS